MGLSTYENVALVETRKGGGMEIMTAKDRLELVKLLVNNGSISRGGIGGGYGSDEHKAALGEVEKSIAHARAMFAKQEEREAIGSDDPDEENAKVDLPPKEGGDSTSDVTGG